MASSPHRPGPALAAALLAGTGMLLNPWTLTSLFSTDGLLEPVTQVKIVAADVLLIGAAVLIWRLRARLDGRVLAVNALLLLVLLALVEGLVISLMHTPHLLGTGRLQTTARALYGVTTRTIQYEPTCAEHHEALGYRLRPGSCHFANLEFSTSLAINDAGLRDGLKTQVDRGGCRR